MVYSSRNLDLMFFLLVERFKVILWFCKDFLSNFAQFYPYRRETFLGIGLNRKFSDYIWNVDI